jgi:hypothetical protein
VSKKDPQPYRPPQAEAGDLPTLADTCTCSAKAGAGSGGTCQCGSAAGGGAGQ